MSLHRFLFRPLFLLNQSENKMFSLLMKLTLKVDDADPRYSHGNGRYKSCRWLHSNSVCRKKSVSHEDSMSWKNKMLSKEEKWKKRVSTCSTRIGNFYISDDKHQNIVNKKVLWTLNIHQSLAILIAGNVKYKNGGWNFWFELWKMFRIKMMVFRFEMSPVHQQ